jgi:hypothetical protein
MYSYDRTAKGKPLTKAETFALEALYKTRQESYVNATKDFAKALSALADKGFASRNPEEGWVEINQAGRDKVKEVRKSRGVTVTRQDKALLRKLQRGPISIYDFENNDFGRLRTLETRGLVDIRPGKRGLNFVHLESRGKALSK